jgi:glycosyltransferase involved in cell wall biosynthesis
MRVALCGPYPLDPTRRSGGVIAATIGLSRGLRQHPDVDLHVISVVKGLAGDKVVNVDGATIHYVAAPSIKLVPNLLTNISRFARKLEEVRPDIVHGESPVGTLAGLRCGFPTVHTVHGIVHKEIRYSRGLGAKASTWLESVLAKRAISGVGHYIAVAKYSADAYSAWASGKMHLVYNSVEDAFFDIEDRAEPGRLFFAGSVIQRKNVLGHLKVVARLVEKHPEVVLRIAGGTPEPGYYGECRAFVESRGLGEHVVFLGQTATDQMYDEHSKAAMLLLLSCQETAPVVVSEAFAAGRPVVASTAGGTGELVKHGETGYLAIWDDTDAIVGHIDELLSNDDLRKQMGARAREDARRRFSIPVVANETVQVYKEVLARN